MIRFSDAVVLAMTKLRTHRVRTGIITVVSGILFGLLVAIVIMAQGIFDSANRYSKVGLGERYIVALQVMGNNNFFVGEHVEDQEVIRQIETVHSEIIAKKQTAAKKYNIEYDPKTEDPSPISFDKARGIKFIRFEDLSNPVVGIAEQQIKQKNFKPTNVNDFISKYPTAKLIGRHQQVMPNGEFDLMKNGKEKFFDEASNKLPNDSLGPESGREVKSLSLLPQNVAESFISVENYDPAKGELPIILPYSDTEKFLNLSPLPKSASTSDIRNRLEEVKIRAGEIRLDYCYRNQASLELMQKAKTTKEEIAKNKNNKDYQKPAVIYDLPEEGSCGPVVLASDTRNNTQKKYEENLKLYQQEIGTYLGDPEQHKLTFRVVGVSAEYKLSFEQSTISGVVQTVLSAPLGHDVWNIPEGLLEKTPELSRPAAVFGDIKKPQTSTPDFSLNLIEFGNPEEARKFLGSIDYSKGDLWAMPFGSSSLIVEEIKTWFQKAILWVVLVVGAIAVLILSGLVGRTIADSRRETAVFRSIGATRDDISSIYTLYTFLFSLRVAIFAISVGLVVALIINLLWSEEATIGADLAFSAIGEGIDFGFIGFMSLYLPIIIGAIILVGFISVILPIIRNVRRNPINDMRDE